VQKRVRMGMVGGGQHAFIGSVHRMAAALDGQIDLVCGAFSRNYHNTFETGRSLGLDDTRLYETYDIMFAAEAALPADKRMEFVCIVTPNHLHVPIAIAAAKAGFHIMSDKPAAMNYAEASLLETVINETGVHYGLTHTYLGYPMVWQAQHLAQHPDFGKIRKIYVEYPQGWLAQEAENQGSKQAQWRTNPDQAGLAGCMGDIGTHAHSLTEFITRSPLVAVKANLRSHIDSRILDDDGEVAFRLENGATGILIASQICTGEENSLKIRIYGEYRSLEWHQMQPNTLIEHRYDGPSLIHRAGTDKSLCLPAKIRCRLPAGHPEGYIEAFANLYRGFADKLRGDNTILAQGIPSIEEALSGMAFLEAIVSSHAQDGAAVKIENGKVSA